ncbi:hypothetical protein HAX54_003236, partial [Datura stramonium]|nr:hypothetical protein [Datura stramonium]
MATFKATVYYGRMENECKSTILGRFLKKRPKIDQMRSNFKELFAISVSIKIGAY